MDSMRIPPKGCLMSARIEGEFLEKPEKKRRRVRPRAPEEALTA
jgi:hypothetical protein